MMMNDGKPTNLTLQIFPQFSGRIDLEVRGRLSSDSTTGNDYPSGPVYIGGLPPGHMMGTAYDNYDIVTCINTILVTSPSVTKYVNFRADGYSGNTNVDLADDMCLSVPSAMATTTRRPTTCSTPSPSASATLAWT